MERINFTLSKAHVKRLKGMSKKMGISVSDFLRRAIDDLWKKSEKKVRA